MQRKLLYTLTTNFVLLTFPSRMQEFSPRNLSRLTSVSMSNDIPSLPSPWHSSLTLIRNFDSAIWDGSEGVWASMSSEKPHLVCRIALRIPEVADCRPGLVSKVRKEATKLGMRETKIHARIVWIWSKIPVSRGRRSQGICSTAQANGATQHVSLLVLGNLPPLSWRLVMTII